MQPLTRSLLTLAVAFTFALVAPEASAAAKKGPVDKPVIGKITAVDKEGKTITVADRMIAVDETSVITKSVKPAKLEDLKVGTDATVSTFLLGEKLTAVSIKTGTVAPTAAAVPKKKK
ncbi:MAG: hypothetical protein ACKODH_11870 [Limisphaerales bacterium]